MFFAYNTNPTLPYALEQIAKGESMENRYFPSLQELMDCFPWQQYSEMRPQQREAFEIIARERRSVAFEKPVGIGGTAIGYTFLRAHLRAGVGPLFYIAPTRTLVDQVIRLHPDPDLRVAFGRGEHDCLYYTPNPETNQRLRADEIPCMLLRDCAHRVDQQTGETHTPGAVRCPYLQQKYEAKQGGIVACTAAFYLFTQFYSREWERPVALVIDEADGIADAFRAVLSFEITDWNLGRAVRLLQEFVPDQAAILEEFLNRMVRIIRGRPSDRRTILEDAEIRELMDILIALRSEVIEAQISAAIVLRQIDPEREREVLNQIQILIRDLRRYLAAFSYSLEAESRHALNYMYAFWRSEPRERERIRNRLVVKVHYVSPIVRRLLAPNTLAYSGTIRDADAFRFETGIDVPVRVLRSDFPPENTRVFLPRDTADLTYRTRSRREPRRTLRQIVRFCREFSEQGQRSLVVLVSESERADFVRICRDEGVDVLSYGNGVGAREVARLYREGQGSVLAGTASNYAQGIDLPGGMTFVIIFLRPPYAPPDDPQVEFERRRFGRMFWRVQRYRAIRITLQVRGRNIRSATDRGVSFFISQQFRGFIPGALPEGLRPSFRGGLTLEECLAEARELLTRD